MNIPFNVELDELSHTKRPRPEDDDGDRDRDRSRRRMSLPTSLAIPGARMGASPPPTFEPSSLPRTSPTAMAQHFRSRRRLSASHHTPPRPRRADRMDVDPKAQLYAAPGVASLPVGWYMNMNTANGAPGAPGDPSAQPPVTPEAAAEALAYIRWIASLGPEAARQIPRDDFQRVLVTFAASLPPLNQQVLETFLQGNPIASLGPEDMYVLAYEIAGAWRADGELNPR